MARHLARPRVFRRVAILVVALAAMVGTSVVIISSASATVFTTPFGKSTVAKNADFHALCAFGVHHLNPTTGALNVTVTLQAQPTFSGGQIDNIFTSVKCVMLDSAGNTAFAKDENVPGPVIPQNRVTTVLPYSPSFTICAFGFVKLRNGNDSTAGNCSN